MLWAGVCCSVNTNKVGLYTVQLYNIIDKLGYDGSSIYKFQYLDSLSLYTEFTTCWYINFIAETFNNNINTIMMLG